MKSKKRIIGLIIIASVILISFAAFFLIRLKDCPEGSIKYNGRCITIYSKDEIINDVSIDYKDIACENLSDTNSLKQYFASTITKDMAEQELDFIYQEIIKQHSFKRTKKTDLIKIYNDKIAGLATEYDELSYYRYIADIIPTLNCGHSNISPSDEVVNTLDENSAFFPLRVLVQNDRIFVTDNYYAKQIPESCEILAINGISTDEILDVLKKYISSDGENDTFKEYILTGEFYYYYTLLLSDYGDYYITYYDCDTGEINTIFTEGVKSSQMYYITPDADYKIHYDIKEDYAKIDINTFALYEYSYEQYYEIIDSFFEKVHDERINQIIIDVRGNMGGDPYISAYFLRYILPEAQPYFVSGAWGYEKLIGVQDLLKPHYDGDIYVLMDGGSFSTTGHFLSKIKDNDIALLIGEQSGATYLSTDGSVFIDLDMSKSRIKLSTSSYMTSVKGEYSYDGIVPDIEVKPDVNDVISYKDTVMKYVIEYVLK